MNSNKLVLVAVAIVAIGIFALPSTVSLFSGQHTWYNLGDTGNDLPCEKCHGDIQGEMISDDNGVHRGLDAPGCTCHRVNSTQVRLETGVASGDTNGSTPGTTSHAAETIACMVCHEEYDGNLIYPFAGGFNQTAVEASAGKSSPYNYSNASNTGEKAAHNQFIGQAINSTLMEDSNEACIACHTRIGVNITWVKKEVLSFNATEGALGNWTLGDWKAEGENTTFSNYPNNWTS